MKKKSLQLSILIITPFAFTLFVWFSSLAFVPVPWPDDSAFYFVAKELFKWPPRWVMLPQAPFEPTYRIFNFNTMPLYPILIGLGRFIGLDGSFGIKFWPLLFWTLSGSLIGVVLFKKGLPFILCLIPVLLFALDPIHRWASVLVRPESLVGLCGLALVLGLSFGFPEKLKPKGIWDPISALLAIAAYSHFNAIHLLFPTAFGLVHRPLKKILPTTLKTLLYLTPWLLSVFFHFDLFTQQMKTQWNRLAVRNDWISNLEKAITSLFQDMGSPEPWPPILHKVSYVIWTFIGIAFIFGLVLPAFQTPKHSGKKLDLAPSAGWILGAIWLWSSKPEVWFIYFLHLSVWTFVGILIAKLWIQKKQTLKLILISSLGATALFIFSYTHLNQYLKLNQSPSWNWATYHDFIDCIDRRLSALEKNLKYPKPFRVWDPTFPDITVELSLRHSDWEFTRTNDFWERAPLALLHGQKVEAVVVPETWSTEERFISGPQAEFPEIYSAWMTWPGYFLIHLWRNPKWKPNRYLCQRGRWQAFLFMEKEPKF